MEKMHIRNLKKNKIDILRAIRKEQEYIIVEADKNLGPFVMELDQYIERTFTDHLNNKSTYKELTLLEAKLINIENFEWLCNKFIDNKQPSLSTTDRKYMMDSILGKRDGNGKIYPKDE